MFKNIKFYERLYLGILYLIVIILLIILGIHFFLSEHSTISTLNIKSESFFVIIVLLLSIILIIVNYLIKSKEKEEELIEQKSLETIRSLNRLYKVLSDVNQAIVRIKERDKLINDICKIVVYDGNYDACWLSVYYNTNKFIIKNFKEKKENLIIRLTKEFNEEFENIERLIKGEKIICNDIQASLNDINKKSVAKELGLISYAVFPILVDNKFFGTVNLVSSQNNFFNTDEVKLLEELVMDLAYALKHFDDEEKRLEAEKQLKETSQMLRLILDTIPVRVFWKDVNLNYLGCNKPFALDSGLNSPKDLIGKSDYDMAWKEQADLYRMDDKFVIETRQPKLNYEEPQTTPDGRTIWLKTSKVPLIDSEGNIKGVLGTYEDITERKLLEESLRIRESQLRTTLYSIGDGVIAVDADGMITMMNSVAENLTGWKENEAIGLPLEEVFNIINEETRNKVENPVRRVLREGIVVGLANHTVLISKDGREFPIADSGAPIFDDNKNIIGVVLVFRDQTEERKIQKAIKESEEKFRELSESALVGVYLIQDNVFKYVNPSLAKTFGYEVDEIIEKLGPLDLTHPEDRKTVAENIRKRIENEVKEIRYEFKGFKKNGEAIFVEVHGVRIIYKDKPAVIGTLIDITERKKAEMALKQAEENFRHSFDNSPVGLRIVNEEGKTIYANKSLLDIYGYNSIDELLNTSVSNRYTKESYEEFKKRRELRKQGVETPHYEISIIRKDGEIRDLDVYRKEIIWNNQKQYLVIYIDITEKRKAEKALKESEERLNMAIQNANIGLWDQNFVTGKIIRNRQWAEMLGYRLEEIESDVNAFINLVHPDDLPLVKEKIREHEEGRMETFSVECRMLTKDKNWKWILNVGKIIERDINGKPLRALGVHIDIDERKQVEEALIRAKEKAEQADKIKTEFLAQVSHEIRTPINIIVSSANLIKDSVYDYVDQEYRQLFGSIDSASMRIIRTIDQILNMSELQAGAFQINPKLIDLKNDVLENLFNEYVRLAENKGLKLLKNYKVKDANIIADEYCVTQIFANLIDNAIKYTKEGFVEIVLSEGNNREKIVEVKDTGIGINEEFLPHLFEPFVQEEQGYSRPYEGNGLGLALVKKYCELNNASIIVESKKNVGSNFKVIFHCKGRV
ncbi:PAS domain S-box protein [Rosettibacter firmus]|uniref:PAS domain S-box protein n=1 Tax=Rosettibacter firmus TaxID=3111522 RepID=UPI00336BF84A